MKIHKIVSQHRRDFVADLVCEHCNTKERLDSGYDDDYYHQVVIPAMVCKSCGKKAGDDYQALKPKYGSEEVI